MRAVFVELTPFRRHRAAYLDEDTYWLLQRVLMLHPEAGPRMPGTGGLRKLRFVDERRGKGTRGGLRVIYYWWPTGAQFWLFTLYSKDEADDLTLAERRALRRLLKAELMARRKSDGRIMT